ncbi:MAG: caspase family protein [Deltaproteobacteria bacterium]|nr:caspase family protein [Deltaproteobacteria bacterium]
MQTKTGDFQRGGLTSRWTLKGDFNIQVDCHMDFLDKTAGMDQVLLFVVRDKYKRYFTIVGLTKRSDNEPAIFAVFKKGKKPLSRKWERIGDFQGTLRIVRIDNRISAFYKERGDPEWKKIGTFSGMPGEVVVGLGLTNFDSRRTSIRADQPVMATFDNFRINSADEISEEVKFRPSTPFTDCDTAPSLFWKGKFASNKEDAYRYYMEAIELCPGFIRPYELIGNYYRKKGNREKAIEFFTKAADLGSVNYKLYYLLADLFFQEGDIDEASRYLNRSLDIRGDYPKSLGLKSIIDKERDTNGPKIILYEPSTRRGLNLVSQGQTISVRGIATDKSGVSWVKVNKLDTSLDTHGNFLKDVPIEVGSNTIVVAAADRLGNQSTLSVTIEGKEYTLPPLTKVESPSQEKDLYGKSFAVVIGINAYEKWPSLEFAVNDARAITEKLKESGFDHITVILDKEATHRRILTELFHELPERVGRNDRLFLYFAGHGQTEDLPKGGKRGYIIPVDGDVSNYGATAISMDQIRSLSSRIPAKHILYAMDSCYSGLGLNRSGGVSPKISDYLRKISSMRVVQIITAGGKGEQVQEKGGHGLFTTYFLNALRGEADFNKDNVVTGTELGAYLRPTVSNASAQAQTPLYGRLEGEGEFLFFIGKK